MSDPVLCASSPEAAVMTDGEFWAHVYPDTVGVDIDYYEGEPGPVDSPACPECGSFTACGYDNEGRPMIHTTTDEDAQ